MTYFNPGIYNYANLHDEDKKEIDFGFELAESLEILKYDYSPQETNSTLENIFAETALEVIREVQEHIVSTLEDMIINRICSYREDIAEIDTQSHFYGINETVMEWLDYLDSIS